jgi:hypothetical protein
MSVPLATVEDQKGNVEKILGFDVPRLKQLFKSQRGER